MTKQTKKDAYYFSHDSNAHQDPKIIKMLLKLKAEGYGVYWTIVEMLRNEKELKLHKDNYNAIAYQSHSDSTIVAEVVEKFDLFIIDENGWFWSESLIKRVAIYREKSLKYSQNAHKRWNGNAIAMQSQSNGNALKESKVKKIKENNIYPQQNTAEDAEKPTAKRSLGQKAVDVYLLKYKDITGLDYIPSWGKHVRLLNTVLKNMRGEEYEECVDRYLLSQKGREVKYSLDFFIATINTWRETSD